MDTALVQSFQKVGSMCLNLLCYVHANSFQILFKIWY